MPGEGDGGGTRWSHDDRDAAVARAFVDGDDLAFEQLYRRYIRPVYDYAYGIVRDRSRAEDVAQSVFLRAYERRATLRDPAAVRAWLYRIAHNEAVNQATRTGRVEELDDDELIPSEQLGPEQIVEQSEATQLVWDAATSLDEQQFTVLDLSLRKGLSSAEVGEVLGLDGPQASLVLHRAREALGNAVRYLVVARRRKHCDRLAQLVPHGTRTLSAEQRATVDHHMRRCPTCQNLALLLTDPAQLFGAILLAALPTGLLEWRHTEPPRTSRAQRTAGRARGVRLLLQPTSFIAAGTLVVAAAAVTTVALHHPPHRASGPLTTSTSTSGATTTTGPVPPTAFTAHAQLSGSTLVVDIDATTAQGTRQIAVVQTLANATGDEAGTPTRAHLTGGVDFLIPITFADNTGLAVVSNETGTWRVTPFKGPGAQTTNVILDASVNAGAITSLTRSCVPSCAQGTTTKTMWHYERSANAFRATN